MYEGGSCNLRSMRAAQPIRKAVLARGRLFVVPPVSVRRGTPCVGSHACGPDDSTRALAQHELLNLAGGGGRQWPEHHRFRRLVVRKLIAAERDDLVGACVSSGFELHESARRLAPLLVGSRNHGGKRNRGVF